MKNHSPRIPILVGWARAKDLLTEEFKQSLEEGREPETVEAIRTQAGQLDEADPEHLAGLWYELQEIPVRAGFPFVEPNDLEAIRAERLNPAPSVPPPYGDDILFDRMHGAWLGRCIGCALGKPVEGMMHAKDGLSSKERIKTYLSAISPGEYPIRDYIPAESPASERTGKATCPDSLRGNIRFMESDDDLRYTVIAQQLLREKGAAFTTGDVAYAWMRYLGYWMVCTAEKQAYRNLALRLHWNACDDWEWVATHHNPYREWIGAQIRADQWGYAVPGNPELAAEFGWRDARLSHVKNGIYGEMFIAATIAAAFTAREPLQAIEAGLSQIPHRSRLYKDLRDTVEACRVHGFQFSVFEAVFDEIYHRLGHYDAVHTNNNAALVVASLLLGENDFEKTIVLSVMGGLDTDCNGATVGSIWGAMFGTSRIPQKWSAPLHDTLYSEIAEYHPIAITECARRSVEIAKKAREV